jgi:hypothetical protein
MRRNKAWVRKLAEDALALPAPEPQKALPAPDPPRQPTPVSYDTEDQEVMTEDQKRVARMAKKKSVAATARVPEPKPVPEAKASKPTKGQESPETEVSPPMVTRSLSASRAAACDQGAVQGKRIRVFHLKTLPKPES